MYGRRRFLAALTAAGVAGLAGCSNGSSGSGSGPPSTEGRPESAPATGGPPDGAPATVGLERVAGGLRAPLGIAFPSSNRRYVADREGVVYVHENGSLRDQPLLDLRDTVVLGGERGLLGIALHPEFPSTPTLYVRYSAESRPGTPDGYSHTFVLSEFTVRDDGLRARRDSERTLLEIPEPQSNHNAGDIAFGPDGYLYVPVGDGGGGGDRGTGHVDDWYDANAGGNGQDVTENLLGSVLRIDVDGREAGEPYAVPDDNPLVGRAGLDEHYAWGLRNPWRISFDGDRLFVADVGQNRYEEVNLVTRGGNYGWNVREGTHCYDVDECPSATPASVRGGESLVDPIVEYSHDGGRLSGVSVIGGHVYRGSALPGLAGTYVFGDLRADGRLFLATEGDDGWETGTLAIRDADQGAIQQLLSFGRDADGEVYALGAGTEGGGVYRLVPA
jgi:glucose/arabinose dehydrogenase